MSHGSFVIEIHMWLLDVETTIYTAHVHFMSELFLFLYISNN